MNISSHLGSLMKQVRYGARLDPARDWMALLTLSIIVLAGLIVWNVWAFDRVARGGVIGAPEVGTPPVFDSSSLDAVHAIFESRAAEETKYRTGVYTFPDPSQL